MCVVGVAALTFIGAASATAPGANGRILFSSDSPGLLTWDLASVGSEHSDGSDLAVEATEQANILGANAISPDGKTWAFSVGDFSFSTIDTVLVGAVGQGDTTQAYANCLPSPDRPAGMYFLADNRLTLFDSADGQYYTCSPDGAPSLVANPQPTLSGWDPRLDAREQQPARLTGRQLWRS